MKYLALSVDSARYAIERGLSDVHVLEDLRYGIKDEKLLNKIGASKGIERNAVLNKDELVYLGEIYEREVGRYSRLLCSQHKIAPPSPDLEILIGPWLRIAINSLYQTWRLAENLKLDGELALLHQRIEPEKLVPTDFYNFHEILNSARWHEYATFIATKHKNISVLEFHSETSKKSANNKGCYDKNALSIGGLIRKAIKACLNQTFSVLNVGLGFFIKDNNVFIRGANNPRFLAFTILRRLRAIPVVFDGSFSLKETNSLDSSFRGYDKTEQFHGCDSFQHYVDYLVPKLIPKSYLESFSAYSEFVLKKWPPISQFNYIFTSTSHWLDDFFKIWLVLGKEKNKKLVIWQHGGTYGTTKEPFHQEYIETKICDYYFTWGWEDKNNKRKIPFVSPSKNREKLFFSTNKKGVLIALTRIKPFSKGDPWDSSRWNMKYVEGVCAVGAKITETFPRVKLRLRLHPTQDMKLVNWKNYFSEKIPNVEFDIYTNLIQSISKAKLTIVTQNSTLFLKCLSLNRPVICYWDTELNPLNSQAYNKFMLMKSVGVFHENHNSVVKVLDEIIGNVDHWWNSKEVQEARLSFCSTYANQDFNNVIKAFSELDSG
jgi:putative transferase (TIGR04331 family)